MRKSNITHLEGEIKTHKEKIALAILLLAAVFFIELILFKFIPDIGTATYQGGVSTLVSMDEYEAVYMTQSSVHTARFLGNHILYDVAKFIGHFVHANDMRLNPLRIAAGILTPLYFVLGALPVYFLRHQLDWRIYLAAYTIMFMSGMYVFYPGDAPSLAMLSLGLAALLVENMGLMLVFLLLTGLFRESAFHFVVLGALWLVVSPSKPFKQRLMWFAAIALLFVIEYKVIRIFYPYKPNTSMTLTAMLFDKGLWSLTTIVSLGMAALFPVAYYLLGDKHAGWQGKFFSMNCLIFPFWILFYRYMGGNISEFRMLWPVLMPFVFGLAWHHERA